MLPQNHPIPRPKDTARLTAVSNLGLRTGYLANGPADDRRHSELAVLEGRELGISEANVCLIDDDMKEQRKRDFVTARHGDRRNTTIARLVGVCHKAVCKIRKTLIVSGDLSPDSTVPAKRSARLLYRARQWKAEGS